MPVPKKPTRNRDPNITRQLAFIAAYVENHSSIRKACKVVGVHRNTVLDWKKKPGFRRLMAEAVTELKEDLFAAAVERAKDKSDTLLIFLLKALDGERFDDALRKAKWEAKRARAAGGENPAATPITVNLFAGPVPENAGPDHSDDSGPEGGGV